MDKHKYAGMFEELDLFCTDATGKTHPPDKAFNMGWILRHPSANLPSVYTSHNNDKGVYFSVHFRNRDRFSPWLWEEAEVTPTEADYFTLRPKSGRERIAFESLMRAHAPSKGDEFLGHWLWETDVPA